MLPETDPDLFLVKALKAGDKSALSCLMERYSQSLYRFIYRYFPHEHTAQELTQDVFVRCYFHIHQFQANPKARFSTWLYRIATNLCRDYARSRSYRKNQKTSSLFGDNDFLDQVSNEKDPAQNIQSKEDLIILQKAIHELPHDLKTALILTALENRSYQECAYLLKTTTKTIEMRVYRARKLLNQKFHCS